MIDILQLESVFFFKQKTAYEIMPSLVGSEKCIRDRVSTQSTWEMMEISRNVPIAARQMATRGCNWAFRNCSLKQSQKICIGYFFKTVQKQLFLNRLQNQ
eukprot:TRINITY_DN27557_c0_g1_i1.p2 TRINITY_DN27557_c0_g1~~TRINITY_DN27557_c0_g1_i1.p2  ORF type:complete len:100 (+),score=14.14 TRINITY_DN27557_c0_g1_i1:26-325(+)